MGCQEFQARARVEAVRDLEIEESLARRGKVVHQIQAEDTGEVLRKLALGSAHSVIIRWDKIPRSRLSIDDTLLDCVKITG